MNYICTNTIIDHAGNKGRRNIRLRVEMEENGQLVKFLYNEDREAVAEEESDGNVIRYIRGLGLISSDSEKAKTYYHYVSDEQGSITHVINGEEKESGELPQEDVQSRVLNYYEYDAFFIRRPEEPKRPTMTAGNW